MRSLLLSLILAAPLGAQSLIAGPLIQGQVTPFDASGFGAGELVVLLASPAGAGAGIELRCAEIAFAP
jgi:hypothetical protein